MGLKSSVFLGLIFFAGVLVPLDVYADESDIVKADRQALAEAEASGSTSKVLAAKEQLSDDLANEVNQKRKDLEGIVIPLVPDGQGHLMADVLINYKTHAFLIVDTGSPIVMLTSSFVEKLGLDLSQSSQGYVEVLNGKYKAAQVSLDSIKVGTAEARDINTTVLLQSNKEIKDGLLGMSFLSKFHFTLDQTGQKLILKKLPIN